MRRRALIIGGAGQLGAELRRQGAAEWDFVAPPRSQLDVTDLAALVEAVQQLAPALVVNCSAFHMVDRCENHFAEALAVNAVAVSALAMAAERVGARIVTVSTDYAFDGRARDPYREEDASHPIQAYGISKVAGEFAAFSMHPEGALVIRSCGLYGHAASRQKGGNFVLNRLAEASKNDFVEIGSDLVCTPTSAADLADAVLALLAADAPAGLYHLTNDGACDWASFTTAIFRHAGVTARVEPIDRGGRYAPARRPAYSVLNCSKAASYGIRMRPWQDALDDYVRQLG